MRHSVTRVRIRSHRRLVSPKVEKKNTFYRYLHVYPASNERWYNIPLHIAVALLLACGILDGVHRIFITQTTAGIVEIVIFGLMLLALPLVYPALAWAVYIIGNVLIGIGRGFAGGILDANKSFEIFSTLFPNFYGKTNPVTFVKSMPKDNRYDKDGKPLANKFVVHLAKQTSDNIDAYLLDLYEESQKPEVMVS